MSVTAKTFLWLATAGIAAFTGGVARAACSDDFTGTALAEEWTFFDADRSTATGSATVNGTLELTGRGKDVYDTLNEFVGVKRTDIQGDFDVSVKIASQFKSHPWAQAGILAANDIAHLEKGGYAVVDVSPSHGYNLFTDTALSRDSHGDSTIMGRLDSHFGITTMTSTYPVWLRLAKQGKLFSAWYKHSADADWTVIALGKKTLGDSAASQIALVSVSHDSTENSKSVFDDFTCLGNTATGIWAGPARRNLKARDGGAGWPLNLILDANGRVMTEAESRQRLPAKALWKRSGF